jgi:hypothetical protein
MTRKACKNCPFREGSIHGYTQDGHDALSDGHEPCCHVKVGAGKQFDNPMPAESDICVGWINWLDGMKGFVFPYLVTDMGERISA